MTTTDVCIEELNRAGFFEADSDYGGMIGESVKELLLTFQKQGHSGYSAQITASIFYKLIKGEPLSPLIDDPSEWMEVCPNLFQNKRISHVFIDKNKSEKPYNMNGKVFSDDGGTSYYTSMESRVYFDLPGFPPKTEYVILKQN